ncbi:hypothetical protein GR203_34965 [Rhizobium leguminosarum]|nr:hypothetical protein [Rhizobium ruizarguesonis]
MTIEELIDLQEAGSRARVLGLKARGSCPMEWCSFGARRAFRTEPGMDQLAAGRLMSGSSLIVAIVSSVM